MPWQTAPSLVIIGGAFAVTGMLLNLTDRIATGKHQRVQIDEFVFSMDQRDAAITKHNKELQKAKDNLAKDNLAKEKIGST